MGDQIIITQQIDMYLNFIFFFYDTIDYNWAVKKTKIIIFLNDEIVFFYYKIAYVINFKILTKNKIKIYLCNNFVQISILKEKTIHITKR